MQLILIKYGELTTKKGNRKFFIKTLEKNIKQKINCKIITNISRMFIEVEDEKLDDAIKQLQIVFGIHSIVICERVNNNIEDIKTKVLEVIKQESFKTFKIETKRSDKKYPISSLEMNKMLGEYVINNSSLKVDVHNPDVIINVEIRDNSTYVYYKELKGLGGYPVGIQGKGLLMLSGGIDSPVAGYLAIKRGISLECIYFDSPPHTSIEAKNKVLKLIEKLKVYDPNIKLHVIPFTKVQEGIYKNCDPTYIITIMRRMMYRISEIVAKKRNCKVIINGESIGQVASQTLTSISVINDVTNMPVIRPVACLDKLEIIDISKKIDTYETSILPFEDCCTIFVPKHPVINPDLNKAVEQENLINYKDLNYEAIKNKETIIDFNNKFEDLL